MKFICCFSLIVLLTACQVTPESENIADTNEQVILAETINQDFAIEQQDLSLNEEEGLAYLTADPEITDIIVQSTTENLPPTPPSYENLWLKLAQGFTFNVPDNARIAKQRNYFLKHPKYLHQVSKRAEPFLFLIIEKIEAKQLPLELVLLPIVESTFNPFAYSSSSASGLWQFMPVTGERFGLKQDWWYDGRRDVYASTNAALSYMAYLHKFLGKDWLHAFAAYNSGEGRVQNAVRKNKRKNKATDYWNLSLPRETENYVPKLLALVDILRNYEKYNIELPFIPNKQVLTYVDTGSQLDLAYAAKLAELSIAEIQLLNPAFNHWATSPDGPHKLLIPTRIATQFNEQLAKSDKNSRVRWARYKVRSGDSLSVIAQKNGTTTNVLKQINDINGSFIKIGQPLLIPVDSNFQGGEFYSQAQRFKQNNKNLQNKRKVQYTIVEGDTLWDISRRYNVTSQEIAKWNNMSTRKTLRLGQKLTLWKTHREASRAKIASNMTYRVRSGDSLGKIAHKFNVKTVDLIKWNKLSKQKYINPGQKLQIYQAKTQPVKQTTKVQTYEVRSGDSLSVIAANFNVKTADLKRWNKLTDRQYIKPGQKLTIHTAVTKKAQSKLAYRVLSGDSLGEIAEKFNVKMADLVRWNKLTGQKYIKAGQTLVVYANQQDSHG